MAKTTKHNISSNKLAKNHNDIANRHLDEEYLSLSDLQPRPVNLAWIEKLAIKLLHWAKTNDNALIIGQFYLYEDICSADYYRWLDKFPVLRKAHEDALEFIGMRRELGGLGKKLDCGMVSYTAAHYDKRCWKKLAEWRSKLTKDENVTQGIRVVELTPVPNSDIVPVKKGKE